MIKVLFICHGNICRSPMAEFVLKDLVAKKGLSDVFDIESAATSREEIGSFVHPGTRKKLAEHGISTAGKCARQVSQRDYTYFDYLVCMDSRNVANLKKIIPQDPEKKVSMLLDYTKYPGDIADPWYTGDFETTYNEVFDGCNGLLKKILK